MPVRRVTKTFDAKMLYREPPHHEVFRIGERLVFIEDDGAHHVFARETDADRRDRFIISGDVVQASTEEAPDTAKPETEAPNAEDFDLGDQGQSGG